MEWALFLETEVSKGVAAGNFYWRYGVYGDFTGSQREGEAVYFSLNESILGKRLELTSTLNRKEEEESYENNHHRAWAESKEEHIAGCSPDLEWIITWQMGEGTERWYKNGEKVYEHDIEDTGYGRKGFISQQTEEGILPMEEKMIIEAEEILEELYGTPRFYSINYRTYYCFGSAGGVLASVNETGWKEADAINIYSLTGEEPVLVYELPVPTDKAKWPIQVSQIVGNEQSGWVVFSYGYETFRMTYPGGEIEKLGEYMFSTSYSPDGKYLAYCTGSMLMWDSWIRWADVDNSMISNYVKPMKEEWQKIPQGWYVMDLETGEKSYIPVPYWEYDDDRPLYGGRCTWIEKDKLLELLEMI
ncbi:MAG: hypothetical protein IJP31_05045 [Lachnospiraceae bacterium]|nr:hypothetical protein [Lachnospiraceae bacterium]